jgi:hypothetical protein
MRRALLIFGWLMAGTGVVCGLLGFREFITRQRQLAAARESAWAAEKAALETALAAARRREPQTPVAELQERIVMLRTNLLDPRDTLEYLATLRITPGPGHNARARKIIQQFENLGDAGATALPPIREFLARNIEVDYAAAGAAAGPPGKGGAAPKGPPPGKGPSAAVLDAVLPPSLRLGLFEVIKRIGGVEAEQLLVATMATTGRGVELLALVRALEEITPGKYRDAALNLAREFLANPLNPAPTGGLDQKDRDYLMAVLSLYKDPAVLSQMQAQLLAPDGTVNKDAADYLKKNPNADILPAIYQALLDERQTDPKRKEELLDLALHFTGLDATSSNLWFAVVSDMSMPPKLREKAIRHLKGKGLEDEHNPTPRDRQLLQTRLGYLDSLQGRVNDEWLRAEVARTRGEISIIIGK